MGLDMYAYARRGEIEKEVDFDSQEDDFEIHYWRKHPNLHGWMHELYSDRGGEDPQFNCSAVKLTIEDLDELEEAVRTRKLPETSGFFFGASDPESEREMNYDLEFIEKARDHINEGASVYYTSWW
jgi:hypothetical protein